MDGGEATEALAVSVSTFVLTLQSTLEIRKGLSSKLSFELLLADPLLHFLFRCLSANSVRIAALGYLEIT